MDFNNLVNNRVVFYFEEKEMMDYIYLCSTSLKELHEKLLSYPYHIVLTINANPLIGYEALLARKI